MGWTQSSSIFYSTQINISSLCTSWYKIYNKYINTDDRKKGIDDNVSGIFPKNMDINPYNKKYQETYGNKSHVVSAPYIKDARIRRVYSGIK